MGGIPVGDGGRGKGDGWAPFFEQLRSAGRAGVLQAATPLWVAVERLPMLSTVFPGAACEPALVVPERDRAKTWTREDAIRELVRGRLEVVGPTTAAAIGAALGLSLSDIEFGLGGLEHEGFVLRGHFTPGVTELEWCERRLLARIHRYTLDRLRREIEPVTAADFMRFLFRWQRLTADTRAEGPEGLAAVLDILDGFELPAGAWESDVLPARVADYDPLWLDGLCLSGEIAWGRLSPATPTGNGGHKSGPIRTTPLALFRRERGEVWRAMPPETEASAACRCRTRRGRCSIARRARGVVLRRPGERHRPAPHRGGERAGRARGVGARRLRQLRGAAGAARAFGAAEADRRLRRRGRSAPFGVETAGRWSRTGRALAVATGAAGRSGRVDAAATLRRRVPTAAGA